MFKHLVIAGGGSLTIKTLGTLQYMLENSIIHYDDIESIYATSYGIANLEYRFLFEQNSFLFLFGNAAWYELDTEKSYLKDTPYGFGAGVSFQTKAGIFSISYALGKQFDNPLLLRAAKVHLLVYFNCNTEAELEV